MNEVAERPRRKKRSTLEERLLEYQRLVRLERKTEALLLADPTNKAALWLLALVKRKITNQN